MKVKHLAMVSKEENFMKIQVGIKDGRAMGGRAVKAKNKHTEG